MTARAPLTTDGWLGKSAAGLVLGFVIAVACSGLFAWFGPGGLYDGAGKTQFNMWLVVPLWAGVLSVVFLFRTARGAWVVLGVIAMILLAALLFGRFLMDGL